ncbi:MAG: hypothetical protein COX51_01025 [Syntrophobacteraceae bacterium CG23_combo_of_CG06-09_8_20_14_all_50_8]|nr:MAG: hypothetical protein COX51_01025 [Syntrophobacteraceae bacterium CG23_combo_of_CG06-09_8_20_14_all_50_8]
MQESDWHIYLGEIPHSREGNYWVSFESDPQLKKTKANIYGRCLPCIQNLYKQLQEGKKDINLGSAFNCWKITAVVRDLDESLALFFEFEKRFPSGHVYGKFGSGRADMETKAVVFHAESEMERDRLQDALGECIKSINGSVPVQISRGCAVLYHDILGDWQEWQPVTPVTHPENASKVLEVIKNLLYRSAM